MIVIGIILYLFIGLPLTIWGISKYRARISTPSREILRLYKRVPKDMRPSGDIKEMLKALDTKHGTKPASEHFMTSRTSMDGEVFSWTGGYYSCRHDNYSRCDFYNYREVASALGAIIKAQEERDEKFKLAGIEPSLDRLNEFTRTARDNADIIKTVTKEMLS